MKIGFSTGFKALDNFWGEWPWVKQYGGSEHLLVELACEMALDHDVQVRLPWKAATTKWRNVTWIGDNEEPQLYDRLFAFDDYTPVDKALRSALVACRSDPPPPNHLNEMIFLSKYHAKEMGFPKYPYIGGGVRLNDYATYLKRKERIPRRVIYTSSPDRGGQHAAVMASLIYDYVSTYKGNNEVDRSQVVGMQRSACVQIHPCDPVRPSEFFSMSILEALAAGTPCIISDADALPSLWGGCSIVLNWPIAYRQWVDYIDTLLNGTKWWQELSDAGRRVASQYDWPIVARRYLEVLG